MKITKLYSACFLIIACCYNAILAQEITNTLNDAYTTNAIKIYADGTVLSGNSAIAEKLKEKPIKIDSDTTIFVVIANYKYEYQIGSFTTTSGKRFKHCLIVNNKENDKRELEFIAPATKTADVAEQIDDQRAKWIALCSKKNAAKLVSELYTSNSVYFNHRPVIIGHEAISKEYAYMNNPNYNLSLAPLHLEIVNDDLAFEIGQCSGSYKGKYLLIWQKNSAGEWQVLVDSNI